LDHCFAFDEADRPRDFTPIANELCTIYREVTGEDYPRSQPKAAVLQAAGLNNQAVSLLDLGRKDAAELLFDQALEIDPLHVETTYNRDLTLWRSGQMTDEALVHKLEEMCLSHTNDWRTDYNLASVHLERGDAESAVSVLEEALKKSDNDPFVQSTLTFARENIDNFPHCINVFDGHSDMVESVAFSPDGRWGLSGSLDNTLRLWELSTGSCLRVFEEHTSDVLCVAITPDGLWGVSGSMDSTIRLWDLSTGQCLHTFRERSYVTSVAISPDGRSVLSGTAVGTVRLWELSTGYCLTEFEGHDKTVNAVAITPDGRWGISTSRDSSVRLWDLKTGNFLRKISGGIGSSLAISPDSHCVLVGTPYDTLYLYKLSEEGGIQRTFEGHSEGVNSVAISPDGHWALSGSKDKTLRLWELNTGRCLHTFEGHSSDVSSVAISPDGRWGLSGSNDGSIRLWELDGNTRAATFAVSRPKDVSKLIESAQGIETAIETVEKMLQTERPGAALTVLSNTFRIDGYQRDDNLLQLHNRAGRFCRRQDMQAAWYLRTFEGHSFWVNSVAISPDGRWALSGSSDNTLSLWEMSTGHCLRSFEGHNDDVTSVSISPDGRWGLSGSRDSMLRLWELSTGRCLRTFKGHSDNLNSVAISPDGRWGLSGSWDSTLCLWELNTGRCLRTFKGHSGWVNSVAFSPDGCCALSGSSDSTLRLWELNTGRCLRTFKGDSYGVNHGVESVAFSPDGRWALSGSDNETMHLWELSTGRCLRTFEGHDDYLNYGVNSVAISPDGQWGISGSKDKAIRLWELSTGRCLHTFEGHSGMVNSVAFSPDGRWILSGSNDETLRLWEFDWEYEFPGWADWDNEAQPYLDNFLTSHSSRGRWLRKWKKPEWNDDNFQKLIMDLQDAGFGWLRPEGVRKQLEKMSADWTGPPSLDEI
jgi:WD40 repeat protein